MKKKSDPLFNIKYIAFCKAALPPESYDKTTFGDFVEHAKTTLCIATKTLLKDPIWDNYTDEEILVEYFIHIYAKDNKKRDEFENEIKGQNFTEDDWMDWVNKEEAKANKEREEKLLAESEDDLSFTPDVL